MANRMNYYAIAPEGMKSVLEMEEYIATMEIDEKLRELIKIRASQINGCAYCINMHSAYARKIGETEQRIFCISAWMESEFYTEKEKVALELTEMVTLIPDWGVPEELYNRVREHFDEKQYVDLILLIAQINTWNRISISMGNTAK